MPARTVLFTSASKFDGKDFRWVCEKEVLWENDSIMLLKLLQRQNVLLICPLQCSRFFFVKNLFICSLLFPENKIVQSMHKIIKYIQQKNVKHKLVLNIGLA